MAALRLILRFRELTLDVDTVREHSAVIDSDDFVWWGWWKKESEASRTAELEQLAVELHALREFDAWLIDTSAERMHRATISDIRIGSL